MIKIGDWVTCARCGMRWRYKGPESEAIMPSPAYCSRACMEKGPALMTALELVAEVKAGFVAYQEFLQKLEQVEPRLTQDQYQECIDHLRRPRAGEGSEPKQEGGKS